MREAGTVRVRAQGFNFDVPAIHSRILGLGFFWVALQYKAELSQALHAEKARLQTFCARLIFRNWLQFGPLSLNPQTPNSQSQTLVSWKRNGNYYSILGLYRDSKKENGNYKSVLASLWSSVPCVVEGTSNRPLQNTGNHVGAPNPKLTLNPRLLPFAEKGRPAQKTLPPLDQRRGRSQVFLC